MNLGRAKLLFILTICSAIVFAQSAPPASTAVIKPNENLVAEGIPPIPVSIAEQAGRYSEVRSAFLGSWNPRQREMLILTRFGDTNQVHLVKMPGGARSQLTFFPDRVSGAHFEPTKGNYFIFGKDIGGGEWFQLYRYDMASGDITLLTDGKSRNLDSLFSHAGDRLVYTSTRRTGKDTDVWIMDPLDPKSDRMLLQLQGGGWQPAAWSFDDKQILLIEGISANETYLWLVDVATGQKKLLTPKGGAEKISYRDGAFAKDGRGVYVLTDKDSEFHRLAYVDLPSMQHTYLTTEIPWDIDNLEITEDGRLLAFVSNENGASVLHVMDTATRKLKPAPQLPLGVIGGLRWHRNGRDLGFSMASARTPSDIYSLDAQSGQVTRWTYSETGGLNTQNFSEPQLIKWRSFDGREISGFLYRPPARFTGKRPVMVNIHGGPEGQSRPGFIGSNNYYIGELGVAMIFPNVRGSTGFGKTFLKLDNGMNRDQTFKDIGALLDWIATQSDLDSSRVMITGGSYGGLMTYAIATFYNDRICCSLPVVGITSLVTFLEHTEVYRRDLRRVEYGDERDPKMREYMTSISAFQNADRIRKPLFAVVGKNDPRVPFTESVQMMDKLKQNGAPVWFLIANDEGHGFAKKKNQQFQFFSTIMFVRRFLLKEQLAPAAGK
ncbi:MAG TPA: prolyl oligopeptidase family serine peptidase [Terriglobales bacterium]|nr:prolyl oligopeptidase family serine peptidase [Terriglobales bacterium]HET7872435.1 prolyl oligopeptidase family serine peptidase [Terriglobales bacterium]